MHVSTMKYLDR